MNALVAFAAAMTAEWASHDGNEWIARKNSQRRPDRKAKLNIPDSRTNRRSLFPVPRGLVKNEGPVASCPIVGHVFEMPIAIKAPDIVISVPRVVEIDGLVVAVKRDRNRANE